MRVKSKASAVVSQEMIQIPRARLKQVETALNKSRGQAVCSEFSRSPRRGDNRSRQRLSNAPNQSESQRQRDRREFCETSGADPSCTLLVCAWASENTRPSRFRRPFLYHRARPAPRTFHRQQLHAVTSTSHLA